MARRSAKKNHGDALVFSLQDGDRGWLKGANKIKGKQTSAHLNAVNFVVRLFQQVVPVPNFGKCYKAAHAELLNMAEGLEHMTGVCNTSVLCGTSFDVPLLAKAR